MSDAFEKLTETQRSCLRFVCNGLSTKEIAIELGLSPNTVNRYIHDGMLAVGASKRRQAARQLVAWEEQRQYKKHACTSQDIADRAQRADLECGDTEEVHRPPTRTDPPLPPSPEPDATAWNAAGANFPLGGQSNDLTTAQRISAIFKLTLFSAMATAGVVIVAKGAFLLFS